MATLWQACNSNKSSLGSDTGRLIATFAVCHPGGWVGQFIREGLMHTERLWDLPVNWTRFFDTGVLVTGVISVASAVLQLI